MARSSLPRFLLVGSLGFVIDTALTLSLTLYFDIPALVSKATAFCIAMAVTFTLNRKYTFELQQSHVLREAVQYVCVQLTSVAVGLAVFELVLSGFDPLLGIWLLIASVAASVSAAILNYAALRYWVFAPR